MPCVPSGVSHFFYLDLLSFSSSRKTEVGLVWRTCTSLGNGVTQETRVCKDGIVLGPMWLALGLWLWRRGPNTLEERREPYRPALCLLGGASCCSRHQWRRRGFVVRRRRQMRVLLSEELSAGGHSRPSCLGVTA